MAVEKGKGKAVATRTATKSVARTTNKSTAVSTEVKVKGDITLTDFSRAMLKAYGHHVVEQRAVPDFRDGLKPVHRCILWAAYQIDNGGFKKAARVVGDVLGKYHPHGDQSVYGALVGLAGVPQEDRKGWTIRHSTVPLIEGYGNYGSHTDSAAAYRYTECRLSKFALSVLLDKNYLAVTDHVPNFSEDAQIPLILPAKLPIMLLNGSFSVAVGVSASTPAFEAKGVVQATLLALKTKDYLVDAKTLTRMLVPTFAYGGKFVGGAKQLYELVKTGKGSLSFQPTYESGAKSLTLTSICPGLASETTITKMLDKVADMKGVQFAGDGSDRRGLRYEILFQRTVSAAESEKLQQAILKEVTKSESYNIGITIRERIVDANGSVKAIAKFKRANIPNLLAAWCDYRVKLEVAVLKHLISLEEEKLRRQKLMLLAVDHLDVIVASLKVDDSEAFLMKKLKITREDAHEILELKVRQLKRLERKNILETIKKIEALIKSLKLDMKKPADRVAKSIIQDKLEELASGC